MSVRRLLLDHLNIDERTSRSADLEPAEVGIVGDSAHRGGYHCGSDRVDSDDYSVRESSRDRAGLTLDAAALDVGMFEVRVDGRVYDLPHFSAWCVGQCKAKAPDARDIREIIWSPDGRTVRRWDALGIRSGGDDSHRWHTHFSFFRDSIKAGRDQTPLFRRYLTTIGLLEDDVSAADVWNTKWKGVDKEYPASSWLIMANTYASKAYAEAKAVRAGQAAILAAIQGLDTEAVLAEIRRVADEERQRDAELPARVLAALPGGDGPVSRDDLEAALRSVLGSVDNETPAS
jgi:hypothetical protein